MIARESQSGEDMLPKPVAAGRWRVMWPNGRTEELTVREMNDGRMAIFTDAHPDCGRFFDEAEGGLWQAVNAASQTALLDGIIELDSERSKVLGFTRDKYDGYLWKAGGAVIISFIVSKRRGNFRELVRRIHALGLAVKVPTPLGRMKAIVRKNGYQHTKEPFDEAGEHVDVWVLMPSNVRMSDLHQPEDSQ